jgi:hypothetical protein
MFVRPEIHLCSFTVRPIPLRGIRARNNPRVFRKTIQRDFLKTYFLSLVLLGMHKLLLESNRLGKSELLLESARCRLAILSQRFAQMRQSSAADRTSKWVTRREQKGRKTLNFMLERTQVWVTPSATRFLRWHRSGEYDRATPLAVCRVLLKIVPPT